MISHQYEEVYNEAKRVAEKAMSLTDITASRHANTYYRQMKPAMSLQEVIDTFRQAFEEKRAEEAELDSDGEE